MEKNYEERKAPVFKMLKDVSNKVIHLSKSVHQFVVCFPASERAYISIFQHKKSVYTST